MPLHGHRHAPRAIDGEGLDQAVVRMGLRGQPRSEVAHALVRSTVLGVARRTRDELQQRYDERTVVARAQGVVMALQECSAGQAGDLIRVAADHNCEQLIRTAERILETVRSEPTASVTQSDGEGDVEGQDDGEGEGDSTE